MKARDRIDAALASLPPVSLCDITEDAALLTRIDRKYLVPLDVAGALLARAATAADAPAVLDVGGERASAYRSVYFDTPDLLSFHLAARGRRRRFKLRTRTYLDTSDAYLEMKTRGARGLTQKERDAYPLVDAERLTSDARDEVAMALAAIGVSPRRAEDLDATLQTRYRRATLLVPAAHGPAGRVTIDVDLEWRDTAGAGLALPAYAIVETKTPGPAGPWDRALWRGGYRPQRVSKYATGLAALHPALPHNRWTRVLSGPFATASPAPAPAPATSPTPAISRKDSPCAAA